MSRAISRFLFFLWLGSLVNHGASAGIGDEGKGRSTRKPVGRMPWQFSRDLWTLDASALTKFSPHTFCGYFADVRSDSELRQNRDFAGWAGSQPTIPVPYEIRFSKQRGLGVFVTRTVRQGAVVHVELPKWYIRMDQSSMQAAVNLSRGCPWQTLEHMLDWCYDLDGENAMMCEYDDGRYFNDRDWGERANVATCRHQPAMTCATKEIKAGQELVEDYVADMGATVIRDQYYEALQVASRQDGACECLKFVGTPRSEL
eukprot:TRINITY_DN71549_c0_g1_i1.p1 TRINITY_DN71549_c0_g1~~TRINITY_DN71549_c0_g1_i1.p1  ORF type:complete len:258 (+),score=11.96 TRINITY_DN71549_c0_g1_i1:64-837(+)